MDKSLDTNEEGREGTRKLKPKKKGTKKWKNRYDDDEEEVKMKNMQKEKK